MALNFVRKLNKNIPSKPIKITFKSDEAHLVCFAEFSWLLRASEGRFERFISHRLVARAVTVLCKWEGWQLQVEFAWNLTRRYHLFLD